MADVLTSEQRHRNMSSIRCRDTSPEIWLRKELFSKGYRYRKNTSAIPGHPDLWLRMYNTAVFVHGCFWHRHKGCKYASTPASNAEFWFNKFQKNTERDLRVRKELELSGIKTLIVWECTVKQMKKDPDVRERVLKMIDQFLISEEIYEEL